MPTVSFPLCLTRGFQPRPACRRPWCAQLPGAPGIGSGLGCWGTEVASQLRIPAKWSVLRPLDPTRQAHCSGAWRPLTSARSCHALSRLNTARVYISVAGVLGKGTFPVLSRNRRALTFPGTWL